MLDLFKVKELKRFLVIFTIYNSVDPYFNLFFLFKRTQSAQTLFLARKDAAISYFASRFYDV